MHEGYFLQVNTVRSVYMRVVISQREFGFLDCELVLEVTLQNHKKGLEECWNKIT